MENQEFDIELLEKKLEEYEQADSNVRSEEVLEFVKKVLDIIKKELYTGHIGDGKIFVSNITDIIRVRTGEEGTDALH